MEIEVVAEDLVVDDDRTAAWAAEPGGAAARRAAKRPASPPRAAPPPKFPRAGSERAPVAVGQRVEGKWLAQKSSAQTRWFLGRAAAVHPDGCGAINSDDGDFDGEVGESDCQVGSGSRSTRRHPAARSRSKAASPVSPRHSPTCAIVSPLNARSASAAIPPPADVDGGG